MKKALNTIAVSTKISAIELNKPNKANLAKASTLALYCYALESIENCLEICNKLSEITSIQNIEEWESIKTSYTILSMLNGEKQHIHNLELKKLDASTIEASEHPDINRKITARRLRGSMIKADKIIQALTEGNTDIEIMRRINQIGELLFIAAMDGSEEFPASKALDLIQEHTQKIKESIEKVDLTQIYPFDELLSAQ